MSQDARAERQAKVERMRKLEKARTQRRKVTVGALVAIPLVVVAVVVALVVGSSRGPAAPQALPPSAAGAGQPFAVGEATDGKPVLDLWEDFQCPACQQLETSLGSTITELVQSGSVQVNYHMLSFLDASLGNDSSKRAVMAAAAADEQGKFLEFHALVYANQPAEGAGFTSAQLEEWAEAAGVEDMEQWRESYSSGKYEDYARSVQEAGNEAGIASTPTIKLDGKDVRDQITSAQSLIDLVTDAGGAPVESTPDPTSTYDGSTTDEDGAVEGGSTEGSTTP
jgi:protein-disulfide isomerase